ncbi:hypothetical protein S245_015980, partial [Arachis hypogaea]
PPKCEQTAVLIEKTKDVAPVAMAPVEESRSICKYWMTDNSVHGYLCQNLHSWFYGDEFTTLAKLHEHKKVVTGIALPSGSDKLYSSSTDGTVRVWDCNWPLWQWIFSVVKHAVKAWNIQTGAHVTFDGPKGQVLSVNVGNDILLAGAEDGAIYSLRCNCDPKAESPFEPVAALSGHTKPVVYCYWMLQDALFWCTMTLNGHTDEMTSLICWEDYLLSSSSDCTPHQSMSGCALRRKLWKWHTLTLREILYGMTEAEAKPIWFCSCKDKSVRIMICL